MDEQRIQKLVEYWLSMLEDDQKTIDALFAGKRYVEALFWSHLFLEKILKAHVVAMTKDEAPKIHDLVRLTKIAELKLNKDEIDFLSEMNDFNLEARYPEIKMRVYKFATKQLTDEYLDKAKKLGGDLCQQLKQNK